VPNNNSSNAATGRTESLRFGFRPLKERGQSMPDMMETFVADQNIMRYKLLLQKETHPDKRRILLQLLADEAEKLPEPIRRAEILRTNQFSIT
jgi:hypothetical protein